MSEFDSKARTWDQDQRHIDRSLAIGAEMQRLVTFRPGMKALEYGAGTGLLSFQLKDRFASVVLMDNSREMISVCEEKTAFYHTDNIKPVLFDLENGDYRDQFDIIFNQMVLHHVKNIDIIFRKFYDMLNTGGQLIIADLFSEDGSFHDTDTDVHHGFDPSKLIDQLHQTGFVKGRFTLCYTMVRNEKSYPVFLLIAEKVS